jgi:phage terminase large subunit
VKLADGRTITRTLRFVPARLSDNPYLARDGNYEARLRLLPRPEREALLEGRWGVIEVPGAVYGEELSDARLQGRVTSVPYDRSALVSTYWDIGISDATAIWCVQRCGREWHLIDYYEERDKTAAGAAGWLKSRGYSYGDHWLPHDAEARERGTGLTYQEVLERAGIHSRITPRMGVEEGISAAKMVFSQCWIDERNCAKGIKTLQHYRREWKARQVQFAAPVHDWASHGADAFRYFAIASRMSTDSEFKRAKMPPIKYPNMGIV